MMRIKEAILRKKIIQQLNDEWKEYEDEIAVPSPSHGISGVAEVAQEKSEGRKLPSPEPEHELQPFVDDLQQKLTVLQKRALKVTWKRLSEAPKTSGRGTIHIMQKVLDKLVAIEPSVPALFYKSAFLSCIDDRKCGRSRPGTISTTRDHALILVEYIDAILHLMFEGKSDKRVPSPENIGRYHIKLYPLGLQRKVWQVLGECLAEVMFSQECVRAYPHAASAWSYLSVAFTDRIFGACKPPKDFKEIPQSPTCLSEGDSPSSDSGCPHSNSNKTSLRSEGEPDRVSGYESQTSPREPSDQTRRCPRSVSIRPPTLFIPQNLLREKTRDDRPSPCYTPDEGCADLKETSIEPPGSNYDYSYQSAPPEPPVDYPDDTPTYPNCFHKLPCVPSYNFTECPNLPTPDYDTPPPSMQFKSVECNDFFSLQRNPMNRQLSLESEYFSTCGDDPVAPIPLSSLTPQPYRRAFENMRLDYSQRQQSRGIAYRYPSVSELYNCRTTNV